MNGNQINKIVEKTFVLPIWIGYPLVKKVPGCGIK